MSLGDWVREHLIGGVREHGLRRGGRFAAQELAIGAGRRLGKHVNYGEPYWERDWDVLIMLDACRHDLMQEVAPAWGFLPDDIPATTSPASMSEEWLERHLQPRYAEDIAETALISANAFTRHDWVADAGWAEFDEVWKHSWSDAEGTVLPRPVTDAAIRTWRDTDAERMIVWYLQPHGPFVEAEWSQGFEKREIGNGAGIHKSVWRRLRDGDLTREQVWSAYRDNLQYVLEDVALLLENLAAEDVVITADHANCLGEWGVYGHPKYVPQPTLKRVPWVDVDAADLQTHDPAPAPEQAGVSDAVVEERLADLGYV